MKTVWLIGRFDLPDARGLADELATILPLAAFTQVESPGDAMSAGDASPDLIVVVQHRPGEFSRRDVEALIASEPLSELVVALGPWCASAMRSERVWPESVVVPLWSATSRVRRSVEVHTGVRVRLPLTAGRDEVFGFDLASSRPIGRPATVSIVTPDIALRELLADLGRASQVDVLPLEEMLIGTIVLWDFTTETASARVEIAALRARNPMCQMVAIVALPARLEIARLCQAGVQAVLPKPFFLAEFLAAIGDAVNRK
ncbi:MAG: hypothetical protein WBC44_09780 [Planctomycetaceae bacterium]